MRVYDSLLGAESRIRQIESRLGILEENGTKEELKDNGKKDVGKSNFQEILKAKQAEKRAITGEKLDNIISAISNEFGLDEKLVKIVAEVESDGKQSAISPKGAIGIMQLMPTTAKHLGVNPNNLKENITGGVKYLKKLIEQNGGSIEKGLAAYNSGPGTVKKYGGIPPFPETQNYVKKIMDKYNKVRK